MPLALIVSKILLLCKLPHPFSFTAVPERRGDYEEYIKDNPEDYQLVKDKFIGMGYKEDKVDKAVKEYFINLCNKQREAVKNRMNNRREAKQSLKNLKPYTDAMKLCKSVKDMKPYYDSHDHKVRAQAAYALSGKRFNPQEAKKVLKKLAHDPMNTVRKRANNSLKQVNRRCESDNIEK